MLIQQHYYTSWSNPRTKRTGFQVKAESPQLTLEMTEILDRVIGYLIPTQLDASDIKSHPVALRYYTTDQIAVLVSSRSSGKDELGRNGNFFAHSLMGTPEQLAYPLAPIFYWDSPFWVSQDASEQEHLPQLEQLEAEVVFDFDAVWSFLNEGDRKQQFYQLLCAVIDYQRSKRRIVIIDDDQSVALWIACICTVLPPNYCYFLSFSTYHHDPGRTPFIITGTTVDSYFRCTADAYISNFILNAHDNIISESPASEYATYIAARLTCERYEDEVLEFFSWLERIDPTPQLIERHLDQYVNFYQFSTGQVEHPDFKKLIDAAVFVTKAILERSPLNQEDVADLRGVCDLLANAVVRQPNHEAISGYSRSLRSLKPHDSHFVETFDRAFSVATSLVLMKQQQDAEVIFQLITELYSSNLVESALYQTETLDSWVHQLRESDGEQITAFWQFLGSKLRLTQTTEAPLQAILLKTFTALDSEASSLYQLSAIATELITWMTSGNTIPTDFLLRTAATYQSGKHSHVLQWIYYALVEHCNLQERSLHYWKYWHLLGIGELQDYEMRRDLLNSTHTQHLIKILHTWVEAVSRERQTNLLNDAVRFIGSPEFHQHSTVPISVQELAVHLLAEDTFARRLDPTLYGEIFSIFGAQLRICRVDATTLNLYEKLLLQLSDPTSSLRRFRIDRNYQIIIQGAIDLTQGILQESTIPQLYHYFSSMPRERYQQEVKDLFEGFFTSNIDRDSHFKLVRGVYIPPYREDFWALYWATFQSQLIERARPADIASVLDLWFRSSGDLIDRHPYVVPEFFTELPSLFETILSSKNYSRFERNLKAEFARKDWYPAVQKYLQKSRKGFLGNFF